MTEPVLHVGIALEKKDPKKKLERRQKREVSSKAKSPANEIQKNEEPAKPRYIASECSTALAQSYLLGL